jgi:hypothetical protein
MAKPSLLRYKGKKKEGDGNKAAVAFFVVL